MFDTIIIELGLRLCDIIYIGYDTCTYKRSVTLMSLCSKFIEVYVYQ